MMKETDLRKLHRTLGIMVALFIVLQAGSGFLISLDKLSIPHTQAREETYGSGLSNKVDEAILHETMEFIHYGGGIIGTVYRIVLGIGVLVMAISGSMIYFKIRARTSKD